MPREKGDRSPGKFSGEDRKSVIQLENRNFRKKQTGGHLPTFNKTALFFNNLGTEDAPEYLKILGRAVNDATVTHIAAGLIEAIQRYHKIGHYSEVVAAQETAFTNYIIAFFKVFGNVIPMIMLHDYLSNPPTDESADTTFGDGTQANTVMALYERDTLSTAILGMQTSGIYVIPGLIELLKKIFFVVEQFQEEKVGAVYSPGANFVSAMPYDKLSDWQANIATLITNSGKFAKYCNMFGVPIKRFEAGMLDKPYTVYPSWDNLNLDIWLTQASFETRDGGADRIMVPNGWASSSSSYRFIFKDKPDEAYEQHMLNKITEPYDATNNLYGGLFVNYIATAQNSVNIVKIYQDDASQGAANGFDPKSFEEDDVEMLLMRFAATYGQTDTINVTITGTYLVAQTYDIAIPLYHYWRGFKKYGLLTNPALTNNVVEYYANLLSLTSIKKDGFSSRS